MAEDAGGPGLPGEEQHDPWAPPQEGVSLGKSGKGGRRDTAEEAGGDGEGAARQRGGAHESGDGRQVAPPAGGSAPPPPIPPAPGTAPDAAASPGHAHGPAQGQAQAQAQGQGQAQAQGYGQGYAQAPGATGYAQQGQPGGQGYGFGAYGQGQPPPYGQGFGQGYGQGVPPGGFAGPGGPGGPGAPGGPHYGYPGGPVPYGYGWPVKPPLPNGKSVAAMVLGIISMVAVCSCWGAVLAIVTSPVALGLGVSARRAVDRGEADGRSQAVAGFVMGLIGTVLSALIVIGTVLALTVFRADLDHGSGSGDGSSVDARGPAPSVVQER